MNEQMIREAAANLNLDTDVHTIIGSPSGDRILEPLDETRQGCPWCGYPVWDAKDMKKGDEWACLCPLCVGSWTLRCVESGEYEKEKGEQFCGLTLGTRRSLETLRNAPIV